MTRTTQLECIVFRRNNDKIEYLLMKRIPKKGGFWQPPCGGMEETDSTLLEAAYRELKEEANISKEDVIAVLEDVHYFEITKHYLTGESIPTIKEYVLGFEVSPEFNVSIDNNIYVEHEEVKWTSFEDAIQMLKWQNNKDAFEKLNEMLTSEPNKNEWI
jgi:dATP pyrophosphohydrolase